MKRLLLLFLPLVFFFGCEEEENNNDNPDYSNYPDLIIGEWEITAIQTQIITSITEIDPVYGPQTPITISMDTIEYTPFSWTFSNSTTQIPPQATNSLIDEWLDDECYDDETNYFSQRFVVYTWGDVRGQWYEVSQNYDSLNNYIHSYSFPASCVSSEILNGYAYNIYHSGSIKYYEVIDNILKRSRWRGSYFGSETEITNWHTDVILIEELSDSILTYRHEYSLHSSEYLYFTDEDDTDYQTTIDVIETHWHSKVSEIPEPE